MKKKFQLKDFVTNPWVVLCSYLISLAGLIVSIVEANTILQYILIAFLVIYFIVIAIIVLKKKISAQKIKNNLIQTYNEKSKQFVDFYFRLFQTIDTSITYIKNSNRDEDAFFSMTIRNFCASLKEQLKSMFDVDFNICFKSICVDSVTNSNVDTWKTITVARVCENYAQRSNYDQQRQNICDNTSFHDIITEDLSLWMAKNIDELIASLKVAYKEYKNPNPNYRKYYNSTIILPIKKRVNDIPQQVRTLLGINNQYSSHYLGFLCLDSKNKLSENEIDFELLMNVMISVGEFLYNLCLEKLLNEVHSAQLAA